MELNCNTDTYLTRDLYLASFLIATGTDLLDLIYDPGGFCFFEFSNKTTCEDQEKLFGLDKLEVKAKSYSEAIKYLKRKVSK
ncbi:MAG: hypothetical protein ACOX6N_04480 [Patescibacteria group bacterium]|jgi:hypothetical protein